MTLLDSISDFLELYLSIDISKKEIDLIKVRSFCAQKNHDESKNPLVGDEVNTPVDQAKNSGL